MKKVLITGKNSYLGSHVEKRLKMHPQAYHVETLSMRDSSWRHFDFSVFDVVFHVAGIAHVSTKKNMKELYFQVNRDLAIEVAEVAQNSGVKHFIFMSSQIIYGEPQNIKITNPINISEYAPENSYGESKLQADLHILSLSSSLFKVSVIRSPMIYGPNCKGNFPKLHKLALNWVIYPKIANRRSVLYIDNFSEFMKLLIDEEQEGIFFPQNNEIISTVEMIRLIRKSYHKKTLLVRHINPIVFLLSQLNGIKKIFGSKYYEVSVSNHFNNKYQLYSFEESIITMVNSDE